MNSSFDEFAKMLKTYDMIDEQGNMKQLPSQKTVEQGASTSIWAAVAEELENKGGLYLDDNQISVQKWVEEIFKTNT